MLFVIVMTLAALYGVGFGMAIAIWQMASEPCCTDTCGVRPAEDEIQFEKTG